MGLIGGINRFMSFICNAKIVSPDTGKERSCAENLCEQNCTQLNEGGFICSCRPGFKASILDRNSCDGRVYFLQFPLGDPHTF